tara:strand:- start:545 stop:928 length:384 start_codon:yes stop_codon:yes gene_type:complete
LFYPFIIFFLILPIIEIWALIKLGSYFGFLGTLTLIIGTAVIGIYIARQQGLGIIFSLQSKLAQGRQALPEIVEGIALLLGALFFIIPGAVTDLFGIILIIPNLRRYLLKLAVNKIIDELRKREKRY